MYRGVPGPRGSWGGDAKHLEVILSRGYCGEAGEKAWRLEAVADVESYRPCGYWSNRQQ